MKISEVPELLFLRGKNKAAYLETYFPPHIRKHCANLPSLSEYKHGDFVIDFYNVDLATLNNDDWHYINSTINPSIDSIIKQLPKILS